jgi:hypothetical protein
LMVVLSLRWMRHSIVCRGAWLRVGAPLSRYLLTRRRSRRAEMLTS